MQDNALPGVPATARKQPLFTEIQKPRQTWLVCMVLLIAAAAWFLTIARFAFGISFSEVPPPQWLVIMMGAIFGVIFPLFFGFSSMVTVIDEQHLTVVFKPLHLYRQELPIEHIQSCKPITYHPLKHFGGWGIRNRRGTRALTMSGNRGAALVVNRTDWLIGSGRPEELCRAVRRARNAGKV